ncbi:hypothetical protein J6TS1_15360 [Siminovitchia terrae]|uniref:Uncharacterized protein n=2 Tax=Siminovitchia terrae TaxID=1914933 RepID=A0A429X3X5_SIMTE|nr:hypothetical protein [Siminovitchia terrae]RST58079.1 hypothetical protein D5F11_019205 [Siminovitchia terrae]GIN91576.1 hypothetical protein J22TS1_26270 [Siminovitchia terrae]GIN95666.1 hypothetical protein J6TS1_15360 [Siminovitchia terrae]
MKETGMKRGQPITFRIPSDAPDHILKQLQRLKETERRNFSSKIASIVMSGVSETLTKQRETLTIPLPRGLTKDQRDWLKHEHSEALLGNIVYQLLSDPVRAVSILASLNSNALEIDDALYLQEEAATIEEHGGTEYPEEDQFTVSSSHPSDVDDLDDLDWGQIKMDEETQDAEKAELEDDPLADFLAQMNK